MKIGFLSFIALSINRDISQGLKRSSFTNYHFQFLRSKTTHIGVLPSSFPYCKAIFIYSSSSLSILLNEYKNLWNSSYYLVCSFYIFLILFLVHITMPQQISICNMKIKMRPSVYQCKGSFFVQSSTAFVDLSSFLSSRIVYVSNGMLKNLSD